MIRKPIKVVHYKSTFPELTENWICSQIAGLDKSLTRVYAFYRGNGDNSSFDNMRCLAEDVNYIAVYFNRVWQHFFHWNPQFLLWFRRDRPDVIHAHFGFCGYDVLRYARWLNIPLITSFYGGDAYLLPRRQPRWRRRYKKLFSQGSLFLTEGPIMRRKLIELGCPPKKVIIHHIGVKLERYDFRPRKPNDEVRLMVCGRFVEKKGIPYAIEAFSKILARIKSDVRLTIVGDSDNEGTLTDEKRKILNAIDKHRVGDAVTLMGYVPHNKLLKIIYDHHILLAPSVHASDGDAEGGFPIILTEAAATGMPVVAFDHCDIPEIIQDGKSGFLVPERGVDALADKLIYLIEHPEIWPEMGRAGRACVEANYNINILNDKLVEIYQNLLDR
jgi:colanic acid/amylovoran biosynthesis glycosyltransferase